MAAETGSATELPLVVARPPGPLSRELAGRIRGVECPAFEERRQARAALGGAAGGASIVLARGRGANVFDVDGNRYVDLAAGFGAALLGHGPSPAHDAAREQIGTLVQGLGDLYASDVKVALLERLSKLHPETGARVMLCQSGADAVTAALKTAALATGRPGIVAFERSYHGLSYAPLAASGLRASFRAPFAEQLNPHVTFVPYPTTSEEDARACDDVRHALSSGRVGAILFEPVLGRGGVFPASSGFHASLGQIAREGGALTIADEIWTGMGRSGAMLRSLSLGLVPDIVCIGKGLGAGFPISAIVATDSAMSGWARGGEVIHTSTHAGAPLAVSAALATLAAIEHDGLALRAACLGDRLRAGLGAALGSRAIVRGAGLIVGVDVASSERGLRVAYRLLERGYLTTTGGRGAEVVILTPPLTIGEDALLSVIPEMAAAIEAEAA